MTIGIPKEIKNNESRVGLTASGVFELTQYDHHVLVEQGAGKGSGISDAEYEGAGAEIVTDSHDIWARADMIVKVKEPIDGELRLARAGQLIFTYFHFASSITLTEAMIGRGAICIAYETVEKPDRSLPLLIPMSEVAGRMAVQQGARYLEKPVKGRGVLLGGVPGVPPGRVLILGAGIVGIQAAKMASGLGAHVTILDINTDRLRHVNDILPPHVVTQYSSQYTIRKMVKTHDLIIGAVLIPGAKAPNLITRDMLKTMRPGTVIVDVAVDQGGCVETCVPTTHENPTYIIDDVLHYCVANMPGAVPFTSTLALTNSTLPYIIRLANRGWKAACLEDAALMRGLNIVEGKVVYHGVAEAFDLPLHGVGEVLA
ncbi:alanine dehydrogenase [Parapedobacter tibetensis]|uniref:alanine dehydrogenase n=1 Tax=Parapedobacter tibetensis TaxID=2972951 RepID=UPI00214D4DFA|nr:alanine dehydrogenase [Parapedobacter tibetensis]